VTEPSRRVLLALDWSPESAATIRAAIDLARALEARVEGFFVEDRDVLDLAAHPLAREVDPMGGVVRPVELAAMERRLRVQAVRARRALEQAAARGGVRCSFHVVRGRLDETVRRNVTALDWVALGRHVWAAGWVATAQQRRAWVGAAGVIVTPRRELRPKDPTRVLYDGSPAGERALRAAVTLAGHTGRRLEVMFLGTTEEVRDRLRSEVIALLEAGRELPRLEPIPEPENDPDAIRRALVSGSPSLLVLPVGGRIGEKALEDIVAGLDFPLLCVR